MRSIVAFVLAYHRNQQDRYQPRTEDVLDLGSDPHDSFLETNGQSPLGQLALVAARGRTAGPALTEADELAICRNDDRGRIGQTLRSAQYTEDSQVGSPRLNSVSTGFGLRNRSCTLLYMLIQTASRREAVPGRETGSRRPHFWIGDVDRVGAGKSVLYFLHTPAFFSRHCTHC